MKKSLKLLFIGNSHTYKNYVPGIVCDLFAQIGVSVHATALVEGGKCLVYHADRRETELNILHGGYDYVILQGRGDNFDGASFIENGKKIYEKYISKTSAKPVLYLVWSDKGKWECQPPRVDAYRTLAREIGAAVAPAGEVFKPLLRRRPAPELYREDGNHASAIGGYAAACSIFYTISGKTRALSVADGDEPHTRLGIDTSLAAAIQSIACRVTREFNEELRAEAGTNEA